MDIKQIFPNSEVVAHCHVKHGDIIAVRMAEAYDAYRFIEVTEENYYNLGNPVHLVRVQRRELPKTLGTIIEIRRLRLVPLNKPILALPCLAPTSKHEVPGRCIPDTQLRPSSRNHRHLTDQSHGHSRLGRG